MLEVCLQQGRHHLSSGYPLAGLEIYLWPLRSLIQGFHIVSQWKTERATTLEATRRASSTWNQVSDWSYRSWVFVMHQRCPLKSPQLTLISHLTLFYERLKG